jgi:hypothetical protein
VNELSKQTKLDKNKEKAVKKTKKPSKKIKDKSINHTSKLNKPLKTKLKKEVHPDHFFVFVSGQRIKNVKELADALEIIDEDNYKHHANENKNDFACWINDIFEEFDLAEKIKTAKNKSHARLIIYKHIANSFW